MDKIRNIILIMMAATWLVACTQEDEINPTEQPTEELTYEGSVLDFIQQDGGYQGCSFDSLNYAVTHLEGLQDALTGDSVTLFAVSDKSFDLAESILEKFRITNEKGNRLSLDDLMIEPFEVVDTLITIDPLTKETDTAYVHHQYDYRESLRQLVGRYIFKKTLTSNNATDETYFSLFNHQMSIVTPRSDAGGLSEAGETTLQLVETSGSKLQTSWVRANVIYSIRCSNGYVHILSPLHEFGFNEINSYFSNYGNEK